jgi:hypothetical protein
MLEYRIAEHVAPFARDALQRFSKRCELPKELHWLDSVLERLTGVTVRELLETRFDAKSGALQLAPSRGHRPEPGRRAVRAAASGNTVSSSRSKNKSRKG